MCIICEFWIFNLIFMRFRLKEMFFFLFDPLWLGQFSLILHVHIYLYKVFYILKGSNETFSSIHAKNGATAHEQHRTLRRLVGKGDSRRWHRGFCRYMEFDPKKIQIQISDRSATAQFENSKPDRRVQVPEVFFLYLLYPLSELVIISESSQRKLVFSTKL